MRRLLALLFLLLLIWGPATLPAPVRAATLRPVRLSVSLPHHMYPRNALVLALVRLRNQTDRPISLRGICGDNPLVEVITPRHNIVYPPALSYQPCLGTLPLRLGPGATTVRHLFVVLRGPWLLPVVLLANHQTVTGPILRIQLYSAPSPRIILHSNDPAGPDIELRPRVSVHGLLYYSDSYVCQADSNPRTILQSRVESDWRSVPDARIGPHWPTDCPAPQEWHVVAGWLDQPVASYTYPNLD